MGLVKNIAVTLLIFYAAIAVYRILYESPPIPDIKEINYWGPGEPKPDDTTIKPFKINIPDAVLEDLKERLKMEVRLMRPLNGTNFEYGFSTAVLREILRFWRSETKYNWRDREVRLNGLPQFTTQVFGLNLHFIHAKPKDVPPNVQVLPLLLLHGFPGTVKEFYEIIPMLTDVDKERDFVFEVIAPSLPGYAFSEGAHKPGLSPANMAAMFRHLMLRLGHEKFYVQGGDWGSIITADISVLYPDNVLGMHSTMCATQTPLTNLYLGLSTLWPSLFMDQDIEDTLMPLSQFLSTIMEESGYLHIQATKPDTIGAALSNSPAGLAAYVLEKFSSWTDMDHRGLSDGGLLRKFSMVDLLDNVMLYWTTNSITTAMRIYSEYFSRANQDMQWDRIPVHVPAFCAQFPKELLRMPEFILRAKYKHLFPRQFPARDDSLYQAVRPPRGGHFAAMEEARLLTYSVVRAVQLFREAASGNYY